MVERLGLFTLIKILTMAYTIEVKGWNTSNCLAQKGLFVVMLPDSTLTKVCLGFTPSSRSSHAQTQNAQAAASEAMGAQEDAEEVDWGEQKHSYKLRVIKMTMKLKSISKEKWNVTHILKWYIHIVPNDLIRNYDSI